MNEAAEVRGEAPLDAPERPRSAGRSWAAFLLLAPLALSVVAGLAGIEVAARDDASYLAELEIRPTFSLEPDMLSWAFLSLVTDATGQSSLGLRVCGLLIMTFTICILWRRQADPRTIFLLLISVFPLYVSIYLNQLRLGFALMLFVWVATNRRFRMLAAPVAGLGHTSFFLVIFPPLAVAAPVVLEVLSHYDPDWLPTLRLRTYLDGETLRMPWYFGWELVGLAGLYALTRSWRYASGLFLMVVGVRMIASLYTLDMARRILEIGILAYSPLFIRLRSDANPGTPLLAYFALLGLLQTIMAIGAGAVRI